MFICDLYKKNKPLLSFEVFPPRPDSPVGTVYDTLAHLERFKPDFISVTYGAGGGNQQRTLEIASHIQSRYGLDVLSHLTCVAATQEKVEDYLHALQQNGIDNILALRGDVPKGSSFADAFAHYGSSLDLIAQIVRSGGFCVAAAAYPEVHYLSPDASHDIAFLKKKIDAGASMVITQVFFDNRVFFEFLDRLRKAGIQAPVSASIMPVFDIAQIVRITSLCGCSIPANLARLFARYAHASREDVEKAGIEYACAQIEELASSGVDGIHICTMNKWRQVSDVLSRLNLR